MVHTNKNYYWQLEVESIEYGLPSLFNYKTRKEMRQGHAFFKRIYKNRKTTQWKVSILNDTHKELVVFIKQKVH